jgi:cytosine/adenosine deaminase-related metal-dependent hydrolase
MRFISADIIFPITKPPIKDGVLVIENNGKILDLLDPLSDDITRDMEIEKFSGLICPAFVNAHCHLELSHLKGKFSIGKGLSFFINEMIEKRKAAEEEIFEAMAKADLEMYENGIAIAGDISNHASSINTKHNSKIYYHTFIELFDIYPERAVPVFNDGLAIQKKFSEAGLKSSIVPHAPYTVSENLLKLISDHALIFSDLISIHNQETLSENEMFESGTGILLEKLRQISPRYIDWQPKNATSLKVILNSIDKNIPLQLVHNTFSDAEDIQTAIKNHENLYWCLCPNANLFIENSLPDIQYLADSNCNITLGTDSYASNTSLSILDELITISRYYPLLELSDLLKWATINGAAFFKVDTQYGSFENGKNPGIILIDNIDTEKLRLRSDSKIVRII